MNSLQLQQTIFKASKVLIFVFNILIFILEIVEYTSFRVFNESLDIPTSAYFTGGVFHSDNHNLYYYNGVKVFYYIIIFITLLDSGLYVTRHISFYNGPFRRDISINAFFGTLWVTASLTNIYPIFEGFSYSCGEIQDGLPNADAMSRECRSMLTSVAFSWVVTILFASTTFVSYKMWFERQERYEGERRVEALGEVVYKYKPKQSTLIEINEPEQVLIYKTLDKNEKKKSLPSYLR
jgi:hypothetical protein